MSTTIETGATPNATETVTVTPPQGNQGATPTLTPDSAAKIAQLERDLESANARIGVLNKESEGHRKSADSAAKTLSAKDAEVAEKEQQIADLLKRGSVPDLLKALDERDALVKDKAEAEAKAQRDTTLQGVAAAAEVNLDALKALDSAGLQYEVKEEKNGKKVTVNGKPFDEHFALFLPSLRPAKAPAPGARPTPQPAPGGAAPAAKPVPRLF